METPDRLEWVKHHSEKGKQFYESGDLKSALKEFQLASDYADTDEDKETLAANIADIEEQLKAEKKEPAKEADEDEPRVRTFWEQIIWDAFYVWVTLLILALTGFILVYGLEHWNLAKIMPSADGLSNFFLKLLKGS